MGYARLFASLRLLDRLEYVYVNQVLMHLSAL